MQSKLDARRDPNDVYEPPSPEPPPAVNLNDEEARILIMSVRRGLPATIATSGNVICSPEIPLRDIFQFPPALERSESEDAELGIIADDDTGGTSPVGFVDEGAAELHPFHLLAFDGSAAADSSDWREYGSRRVDQTDASLVATPKVGPWARRMRPQSAHTPNRYGDVPQRSVLGDRKSDVNESIDARFFGRPQSAPLMRGLFSIAKFIF